MPFNADGLEGLGCQMRPQFTEHGEDIGGKPRIFGTDVREDHATGGGLHLITMVSGCVGSRRSWRAMAVSTVSASRRAVTS